MMIASDIQHLSLQHDAAKQNADVKENEDKLKKKRAAGEEALKLLERDVTSAIADIEKHLAASCLGRMHHL